MIDGKLVHPLPLTPNGIRKKERKYVAIAPLGGDDMMSNAMHTQNFDYEIDDDININYNSARVESDHNSRIIKGTVRNRKAKFGSF